jgi:hypothetical protein
MKEIKSISIVCSTGAETYTVGVKKIDRIDEQVIQISDSERASFYVALDKNGNELVRISLSCPIVISRI